MDKGPRKEENVGGQPLGPNMEDMHPSGEGETVNHCKFTGLELISELALLHLS